MKALIIYFSQTGTTRKLAETIAAVTGGELLELKPETPYPAAYGETVKQARKEIAEGYLPPLVNAVPDVSDCDTVFVGSPNWCGVVAPPVAAMLSKLDLTGKTVAPFSTNGGGGAGQIEAAIKKLCPNSTVCTGLTVDGACREAVVSNWTSSVVAV